MDAGPAQRRDVVGHDLAHEGVGEPEGAGPLVERCEQAVDDGRVEVVEHGLDVEVRRPDEQVELDLAADHGGDLQQPDGRFGEEREAAAHDVAHARRHVAAG